MPAFAKFCIFAAAAILGAAPIRALPQSYPQKPVRILSPLPIGLSPDVALRALGELLSKAWGQPVIVDPRPGASGILAMEAARKSPADGYTLLFSGNGQLVINPAILSKLPYDSQKDYAPISIVYMAPFFIAVSAAGPHRSLQDLIAAAKAQPGKLSYSSPNVGSPGHLGSALFEHLTGTKMLHVPFKDGSQVSTSVASGDVDWTMLSVGSLGGLLAAGRVRLLAIAAPRRMASQPDVPTVLEAKGPAEYFVGSWNCIVAQRDAPQEVIHRVSTDMAAALKVPALRDRYAALGIEATSSTPAQLADLIRTDLKFYADLVKTTGISAQ